ncbi:hypothetical protein [Butyrivibrio sp. VCD2006]|uniref:hypothetical protein n=1 Tax=Butyrivibrio sp. VCD2006 TaxID=1280664 RepID=UPI0004113E3E|nr:hypothetical protein [Butyrivibrio sp. VCD2006]
MSQSLLKRYDFHITLCAIVLTMIQFLTCLYLVGISGAVVFLVLYIPAGLLLTYLKFEYELQPLYYRRQTVACLLIDIIITTAFRTDLLTGFLFFIFSQIIYLAWLKFSEWWMSYHIAPQRTVMITDATNENEEDEENKEVFYKPDCDKELLMRMPYRFSDISKVSLGDAERFIELFRIPQMLICIEDPEKCIKMIELARAKGMILFMLGNKNESLLRQSLRRIRKVKIGNNSLFYGRPI